MRTLPPGSLYNLGQMYKLGLGRSTGAAVLVLTDELNNDAVLEDLSLLADQFGLVDDIKVGGQSCMCSDKGADILMFHPEASFEGARAFGFPVHKSIPVRVEATLAAVGTLVGDVGIQPVPPQFDDKGNPVPFPDVNGLGDALDLVFGLGSLAIAAGATEKFVVKAMKTCTLGAMVIDSNTASSLYNVEITEITLNRRSLLGGTKSIPLSALSYLATDLDGRTLGQDVVSNQIMEITCKNNSIGPVVLYGGIWCMPPRGE